VNARDILFETRRFNLSTVGAHFINPCCFGEDLASWLRDKLALKGVDVSSPGQEDWGWYLIVKSGTDKYFLGMSGNSTGNSATPDDGEWRIIVEKSRSVMQRLAGKGKISANDAMFTLVKSILEEEPEFREVHDEVS
jgi:hypothetical protein